MRTLPETTDGPELRPECPDTGPRAMLHEPESEDAPTAVKRQPAEMGEPQRVEP